MANPTCFRLKQPSKRRSEHRPGTNRLFFYFLFVVQNNGLRSAVLILGAASGNIYYPVEVLRGSCRPDNPYLVICARLASRSP